MTVLDKELGAKIHTTPAMGPVRKNIVNEHGAFTHALSWVFPHPKFKGGLNFQGIHGFGRDGLVRKAGRMACSMFLTSRPPNARKNANGGFQSRHGAEAMTTVNTTTTPKTGNTSTLHRQQAIESALSAALFHIRQPYTQESLWAATGRTNRAMTLLKHACTEAKQNGGVV